jgi:hypothetical protein
MEEVAYKGKKTQPVRTQTKTVLWDGQRNGCQPKLNSGTDKKLERKCKTNLDAYNGNCIYIVPSSGGK